MTTFTSSAGNNRLDGYCYDLAGNLLDDGPCPATGVPHKYTYDAENRLVQVNNGGAISTYLYNAEGQRARKTTPTAWVAHPFALTTVCPCSSLFARKVGNPCCTIFPGT